MRLLTTWIYAAFLFVPLLDSGPSACEAIRPRPFLRQRVPEAFIGKTLLPFGDRISQSEAILEEIVTGFPPGIRTLTVSATLLIRPFGSHFPTFVAHRRSVFFGECVEPFDRIVHVVLHGPPSAPGRITLHPEPSRQQMAWSRGHAVRTRVPVGGSR